MAKTAGYPAEGGGPLEIERPRGRANHQRIGTVLMLPREHGAWAMLLMPYLLGTIAAGRVGWPSLLLLAAVLLLFTASRPAELVLQGRGNSAVVRLVIYVGLSAAAGISLLLLHDRWLLLPIGLAAGLVLTSLLVLRGYRLDRTWPARIASIAALSSTGPAAYYAATGMLGERALAVWVLAVIHSGASVFYVRLFYRPPDRPKHGSPLEARIRAERQLIVYVVVALGITVALGLVGFAPPLGLVALLPLAYKAVVGCRHRDSRPTLRQIGFAELGHTALFLALASMAMLFWS